MKYLLLNRDNIVVDILEKVRYMKLQQQSGLVIACTERDGTGVIGSDNHSGFTLAKADINNSPDAVYIMPVEDEVLSAVAVGKVRLNTETGEFEPRYMLSEAQKIKQEENKNKFAVYLSNHPLTWVDGKTYGVTQEDQSEISLNLNQYQVAVAAGVETPILEWHAQHEECVPWTVEQLTALSLAIAEAVYPIYHLMQQYKTAIYSTETIEELDAISLLYGDEEEGINNAEIIKE